MAKTATTPPTAKPTQMRPRPAATYIGTSVSMLDKFERMGRLTPVRIPGVRAKWYLTEQLDGLFVPGGATAAPPAHAHA
jgi:hypothetical protein